MLGAFSYANLSSLLHAQNKIEWHLKSVQFKPVNWFTNCCAVIQSTQSDRTARMVLPLYLPHFIHGITVSEIVILWTVSWTVRHVLSVPVTAQERDMMSNALGDMIPAWAEWYDSCITNLNDLILNDDHTLDIWIRSGFSTKNKIYLNIWGTPLSLKTSIMKVAERKGNSLSGCFSLGVMERIKSWGVM